LVFFRFSEKVDFFTNRGFYLFIIDKKYGIFCFKVSLEIAVFTVINAVEARFEEEGFPRSSVVFWDW